MSGSEEGTSKFLRFFVLWKPVLIWTLSLLKRFVAVMIGSMNNLMNTIQFFKHRKYKDSVIRKGFDQAGNTPRLNALLRDREPMTPDVT